jgi:hypothetical protein
MAMARGLGLGVVAEGSRPPASCTTCGASAARRRRATCWHVHWRLARSTESWRADVPWAHLLRPEVAAAPEPPPELEHLLDLAITGDVDVPRRRPAAARRPRSG